MIRWNDNYITGIEKLDKEHQQLFQMADQVLNKLRERGDEANYRIFLVRETLTYITSYFERHAKAEEEYMRKIGYTGYTLHKMLHDEFCNIQLKKYQDIVKRGECSKEEIQDFIGSGIGWLLEHIATADMAIIGKGILAAPAKKSDFDRFFKYCGKCENYRQELSRRIFGKGCISKNGIWFGFTRDYNCFRYRELISTSRCRNDLWDRSEE